MSQVHGRRNATRFFTDDELHRAAWPKTDADNALLAEYRRVMDEEIAERREDEEARVKSYDSWGSGGALGHHPRPWSVRTEESGYNHGQPHVYIVDADGKFVTVIDGPSWRGVYKYGGVKRGVAEAICLAVNK